MIRIGEEYLDGSVIGNNEYNNNAQLLRDNFGDVTAGLNDDQCKIYTEVFDEIAFWDNYNLLVLENDDLKLFPTGSSGVGIEETEELDVSIFPNPSNNIVNVQIDNVPADAQIVIQSIDGKEVMRSNQVNTTTTLDVTALAKGAYLVKVLSSEKEIYSDKLIIE